MTHTKIVIRVAYFKTKQRWTDVDLQEVFPKQNKTQLISAKNKLTDEGYIHKETNNYGSTYVISDKGSDVLDKDGFKSYFDDLNRKEEEIKDLIDQSVLQTNKSVIDTNKTVQKNVTTQDVLLFML